jgi:hypothetical protein
LLFLDFQFTPLSSSFPPTFSTPIPATISNVDTESVEDEAVAASAFAESIG